MHTQRCIAWSKVATTNATGEHTSPLGLFQWRDESQNSARQKVYTPARNNLKDCEVAERRVFSADQGKIHPRRLSKSPLEARASNTTGILPSELSLDQLCERVQGNHSPRVQ